MAAISRSNRSNSGIALIIGGALVILTQLLPLLGVSLPWLWLLAYAAIAVALVILALGAVNNTVAKIALFVGAAGFAIIALTGFGIALPAILVNIAATLAGLGFLIGAAVLYVGKEITNRSGIAFVVAGALAAVTLLGLLAIVGLGAVTAVFVVAFGIALIVSGVLFRRAENRR